MRRSRALAQEGTLRPSIEGDEYTQSSSRVAERLDRLATMSSSGGSVTVGTCAKLCVVSFVLGVGCGFALNKKVGALLCLVALAWTVLEMHAH